MQKILQQRKVNFELKSKIVQTQINRITLLRFFVFINAIFCVYIGFKKGIYFYAFPFVISTIIFFILIKYNDKLIAKKNKTILLQKINEKEIAFLQTNISPYKNGAHFLNTQHLYSNDIDVFGYHSLYAHLNRTATVMGETFLANLLQNQNAAEIISNNQNAVKELTPNIEFRQQIFATAQLANDDTQKFDRIIQWCKEAEKPIPTWMRFVMVVSPLVLVTLIILYQTTTFQLGWPIIYLFLANTYMFAKYGKRLFAIIGKTEKVHQTIQQYSSIIKQIETLQTSNASLIVLQQQLLYNGVQASTALKQLSSIISNIESIQNLFGAFIVNGLSFFHLYQLKAFTNWKLKYANHLTQWLQVIGQVEALNSLANFSANNTSYTFPQINHNNHYSFQQIGHPLIASNKRICNDWSLQQQSFVVLSGSNMSGKSTFLRTIGINLVLANAGAPVCAIQAQIGTATLVTCMRLNDSLEENASYFFAEVKRLQQIVLQCQKQPCFIILDEILRGTNSDDKQQGTIKVLEKLISLNATGIVATHDVEVCNWGNQHNNNIQLQCFESAIVNNELYFDYTLHNGICKNKSASFLLQKLNVIDQ